MISEKHNAWSSFKCREAVDGEKCLVVGSVCSPTGGSVPRYDVVIYSCVIPTVENTDKWGNTCKWHFEWDKKEIDSIIGAEETDTISKLSNRIKVDNFILRFLSDNPSFPSNLSKLIYRLLMRIKEEYHREMELNKSLDNLILGNTRS